MSVFRCPLKIGTADRSTANNSNFHFYFTFQVFYLRDDELNLCVLYQLSTILCNTSCQYDQDDSVLGFFVHFWTPGPVGAVFAAYTPTFGCPHAETQFCFAVRMLYICDLHSQPNRILRGNLENFKTFFSPVEPVCL